MSILGPASQKVDPANAQALVAVPGVPFPSMLDSIRSVFQNMRVVSHSVQLLPICAGGTSDQPAPPIEIVYSRFGIDGGGNTAAAPTSPAMVQTNTVLCCHQVTTECQLGARLIILVNQA